MIQNGLNLNWALDGWLIVDVSASQYSSKDTTTLKRTRATKINIHTISKKKMMRSTAIHNNMVTPRQQCTQKSKNTFKLYAEPSLIGQYRSAIKKKKKNKIDNSETWWIFHKKAIRDFERTFLTFCCNAAAHSHIFKM
jgi:hypothetical protein